jgi:NAD(P)-dependent dehydrogenase (short-subunit alcohol dehydrogenase family)
VAAELGPDAVHVLDVRDDAAVERIAAAVVQRHERHEGLDVLINNAGTIEGWGALRMSSHQWRATIDTNLTGAYLPRPLPRADRTADPGARRRPRAVRVRRQPA